MTTLEQGMEVHEDITRNGFHFHVFGATALVDMISKCGSIENYYGLFDKKPHRYVTSSNEMIAQFIQNVHIEEALKSFQKIPE